MGFFSDKIKFLFGLPTQADVLNEKLKAYDDEVNLTQKDGYSLSTKQVVYGYFLENYNDLISSVERKIKSGYIDDIVFLNIQREVILASSEISVNKNMTSIELTKAQILYNKVLKSAVYKYIDQVILGNLNDIDAKILCSNIKKIISNNKCLFPNMGLNSKDLVECYEFVLSMSSKLNLKINENMINADILRNSYEYINASCVDDYVKRGIKR